VFVVQAVRPSIVRHGSDACRFGASIAAVPCRNPTTRALRGRAMANRLPAKRVAFSLVSREIREEQVVPVPQLGARGPPAITCQTVRASNLRSSLRCLAKHDANG
jgi:hypothetical protein